MRIDDRIERAAEVWDAALWWQADENALVYAGKDVQDPFVTDTYSVETVSNLAALTGQRYYAKQEELFENAEFGLLQQVPTQPVVIDVFGRNVGAFFQTSTMEWLVQEEYVHSWHGFAVSAIVAVRAKIFQDELGLEPGEEHDEGSGIGLHEIEGLPNDKRMAVPHLVVNPMGCSCIGSNPDDREWSSIKNLGFVELYEHNVDSHRDSLPLAAGLAAINTVILDSIAGK